MSWATHALAAAEPKVFWTDGVDRSGVDSGEIRSAVYDLAIIGGGFTGLWAALQAVEDDPGRRVIVLESESVAFGATGRNGGFCSASLTHGLDHGHDRWPEEIAQLQRLGFKNLDGIAATIDRHGIDAGFARTGELNVATTSAQVDELGELAELAAELGAPMELLDASSTRARIDSPTYLGGLFDPHDTALVDPARLAIGLARVAAAHGVDVVEGAAVRSVDKEREGLLLDTARGRVRADRVVVATNAYRKPLGSPGRWIIPVYDHVLMTEPLSAAQLASIGWDGREGAADSGNQFHYFRLTDDDRILWGGWDATYHFGGRVGPQHDQRPETHRLLAEQFAETFPQLEGLRFSHRWGGPIATTSRFTAMWGSQHDGRLVWVGGYTGLGVGASRFGARVALDLVDGRTTERTELQMVRRKPVPFPPEPLRWPIIELTKRSLARADKTGKPNPWLRLLDKLGLGFDS